MLIRLRNSKSVKRFSIALSMFMFSVAINSNTAFAQDGGPTQPEVQSFEPIGTNQMVDLFTGDFTYNIPLFNIPGPDGGYPINLAYHSGVQMEQEASWVGLGWNINVGTINRQVRNLPDDYGGSADDKVKITTDMKTNWTVGVTGSKSWELFGKDIKSLGDNFGVDGSFSASVRLYYNNYRGVGYSLRPSINLQFGKTRESEPKTLGLSSTTGDLGFGLSLDSQEGISSDVTLGFSDSKSKISPVAKVGTGFNSRTGWKRNIGIQGSMETTLRWGGSELQGNVGGGSNLSFAQNMVSINIPNAMKGWNGSLSFGHGFNVPGNYNKWNASIDFSQSKLKYKNKEVSYRGVGYLHYQSVNLASDPNDHQIRDVSTHKATLIHKNTQLLGTPQQDYDIYSVTGQGVGSAFRPHRGDIITNLAPNIKSSYGGGSAGLEVAPGSPTGVRMGIDLSFNYSSNRVLPWPNAHNDAKFLPQISQPSITTGVYFQNYGEQTYDDLTANYGAEIAAASPVAYRLDKSNDFFNIVDRNQYVPRYDNQIEVEQTRPTRKRRALGIEAYENHLILDDDNNLVINEFAMDYFANVNANVNGYDKSTATSFNNYRATRTSSHVGGYIATNTGGLRYVYGLAAYNKSEVDLTFSVEETVGMENASITSVDYDANADHSINYDVKGSNEYFQKVEKTPYAHSYMLTSILGSDYVDLDNVAGPSDNDLGYWVKFNYAQAQSDMLWRAPFEGALYDEGYETSFSDGVGRVSHGTKEVWYLATVETKTHVAEFIVSPREDAYQPGDALNNVSPSQKGYYKLDRINVYSKAERYPDGVFDVNATPIKTCHFVYDYSLCQNVPSNIGVNDNGEEGVINNDGGKLTLKKFYFTYRGNDIGKTTPYSFEYNSTVDGLPVNYDRDAVDRWGNYQPNDNGSNLDYPYNSPYTSESTMNQRAALWSIKAINLPSGGRYEIDYESDSYAYVQDEVAMQMFEIVSLDKYSDNITGAINHPRVANSGNDEPEKRKVYFKLENPIPEAWSVEARKEEIDSYIKPDEYMYFKVKILLTQSNDAYEHVAGYAKVKEVGIDMTSSNGSAYQWGYVLLDFMKVGGEITNFHPFTEAGARHIKYNQPDLLYDNPPSAGKDKLSKSEIKNLGWSLISNVTDFRDIFSDFTRVLTGVDNNKRLDHILLGESWIRLRTPDKVKLGGGHRVKEVRIIDNWADAFLSQGESSSVYGTVYDYSITERGKTFSSGVAAYEPMVGGDEIPLRKPLKGWEDDQITVKNLAQTYTEEPGNESLFPGPTVGYRQVKVMSLNTANRLNGNSDIAHYSGVSVNEFYTAKDFPVIQEESKLKDGTTLQKGKLMIPALLLNIERTRTAASQGYYIELNDMHGKPKGGYEIGFGSNGNEEITSSIRYEYFKKERERINDAGELIKVCSLNNEVDVLFSDLDPADATKADIRTGHIGTQLDFIPEVKYSKSKSMSGGVQMNFETFTFVPAFYPIPNFNYSVEKTGTVVTNKIVNKSGIVKSVTASKLGSVITTENLVFDQYSGTPLLTSVNNNFENKVYNYSIMAYDQYDRMGPAYKNIGMATFGTPASGSGTGYEAGVQHVNMTMGGANLIPGDVLHTRNNTTGIEFVTVFKQKSTAGDYIIETPQELLSGNEYTFRIIRSGNRNQLSSPISSIAALSNPTINREVSNCTVQDRDETVTVQVREIDNVLSIGAEELGDSWYKDTRQISEVPSSWTDENYFSKGMSGVYSGVRSYAYVDDRTQTETLGGETQVDLEVDGVMNDVALFNWDYILADGVGCPSKWIGTNQITLKNPSSSSIETKNILGVYTSTLYGKGGTEPIAMAGNARNTEIGFENFEEYPVGNLAISDNATNNLNFYTEIDANWHNDIEDRFDVYGGFENIGFVDIDQAVLDDYSTDFVLRIHFDGNNSEAEERLFKSSLTLAVVSAGVTRVTIPMSVLNELNLGSTKRRWRGELFALKQVPSYPSGQNTNCLITEEKSHTGQKAFKVTNLSGGKFLQGRLTLTPGEKYELSGWFSSPNNIDLMKLHSNYFYSEMKLEFFDFNGVLVGTETLNERDVLVGNFIDEWHKFDVEFTMPIGAHYVSITLPTANQVYDPVSQTSTRVAYYDDVRIQPLDGGLQSYVYNQENQRLEATLDGNNYATFYYYDDEGNLFLVKRETEEGIITVQESRTYIKRN